MPRVPIPPVEDLFGLKNYSAFESIELLYHIEILNRETGYEQLKRHVRNKKNKMIQFSKKFMLNSHSKSGDGVKESVISLKKLKGEVNYNNMSTFCMK